MHPTLKPKMHRDYMHTIAKNVATGINSEEIARNGGGSRRLLAKLAATLTLNLSLDYQAIYPYLCAHLDSHIRDNAAKHKTKIADLGEAAELYIRKWESETAILKDPKTFVTDTREIFSAMALVMEETDNILTALTGQPI